MLPNIALIALIKAFAEKGLQEKDSEMFENVCRVYCQVAKRSAREVATQLNETKAVLEKKFDFFLTCIKAVEAKLNALLRVVYWLNKANEDDNNSSELFTQFVQKIQSSKVSDMYDAVKQDTKNKF